MIYKIEYKNGKTKNFKVNPLTLKPNHPSLKDAIKIILIDALTGLILAIVDFLKFNAKKV